MARDSEACQPILYRPKNTDVFLPEKQFEHGIYALPIVRIAKTLIFDGPMFLPEKQS